MKAVKHVSGKALPLGFSDVDTDQIAPSDAMKLVNRTDFSKYLFRDWRENPDFVLNKPEHKGSVIIIAGDNFGCGSSREHAPWALEDYGFGAIIAPSFGDIFKNNCSKVGLLAVELPDETVEKFLAIVHQNPESEISVNLEKRTVTGPGVRANFEMDDFTRQRIMKGLDDINLTLLNEENINRYEQKRPRFLPSLEIRSF